MRGGLVVVGLLLFVAPSAANAQVERAAEALQMLVTAASQPDSSRPERIRESATALNNALADWDRAIETLAARTGRDLTTAAPRRAFQLHVELGLVYRMRGRLSDALREFDAAVALDSQVSDLHFLRGLTLEAAGQGDDAATAFRTAWQLDRPNPTKTYYALQRDRLIAADDRGRALKALEDAYTNTIANSTRALTTPAIGVDLLPDWASSAPIVGDDRTGPGFALLAAGRYSEGAAALARLDQRATAIQGSPLIHFQRAQSLEAEGNVSGARGEYADALDGTLTGRAIIYVAIGRLARVEGDAAAAITAYSHAVRLNPNDPTMRLELANAYAAAGNSDSAFAEIVGGLLRSPTNAQFHAAIGQLRLDAGRPDQAIAAFTRAIELAPDQYELRYALATALTRSGRSQEAAAQLQLFERVRREMLERRRKTIQDEVERNEESIRQGLNP
jgi:tetratricopeptide (TPR) repeat protein